MNNGKRVVVVLPAYNAARTLERTLAEIPPGNVNLEANRTYTFVLAGRPNRVETIQIKDDVARDPDKDDGMPDDRTEKSPNN